MARGAELQALIYGWLQQLFGLACFRNTAASAWAQELGRKVIALNLLPVKKEARRNTRKQLQQN